MDNMNEVNVANKEELEACIAEIHREYANIEINGEKVTINIGDNVRCSMDNNIYEVVDINHVYDMEGNPVDLIRINYNGPTRAIRHEHISEVIKKGEC